MKITVLGAGAMGSVFGGLLAEIGHEVTLLDVNAAHIARVREHGLRLQTDARDRHVRVAMARPEEVSGAPDWLLVFTKTVHTEAALRSAAHLLGPATRVLSLQNGLGNEQKLAVFVPLERVALGVTTVPADLVAPGQVHSHGKGGIRMMMADGRDDEALQALARALNAAGLPCMVDPSVQAAIWEKVAFNAALNSLCAVSGCTVGELGADQDGRALAHGIVREVLQVARDHGVSVSPEQVGATLDHAFSHHLQHQPSMLQDVLARRATEIEAINGAVVCAAQASGTAVPRTQALYTLVRLIEQRHARA